MNLPAAFFATRSLAWETVRQSLAARLTWLMLSVSGLCILFCLSVRIEGGQPLHQPDEAELYGGDNKPLTGPNPQPGHISLGFGATRFKLFRDGPAAVRFLEVLLAKWVGGAVGVLLALIFTAGFLPDFLQPSSAAVMLAKPAPRWSILLGKYLGVVAIVAGHSLLFFSGTFLALGLGTGYWLPAYLWSIPLLLLHFAIMYSFSVFLAVATRNTTAAAFGSLLLWLVCFGMNYGHHASLAQPYLGHHESTPPAAFQALVETGYWILPKPADLLLVFDRALHAEEHFGVPAAYAALQSRGMLHLGLSVLTSVLAAILVLVGAAWEFTRLDY
jgi:hypothetical protein